MRAVRKTLHRRGFSGVISDRELMSGHCSLRVGGPARLFAVPETADDLNLLLDVLTAEKLPWCVIGGGTNVLFANGGYKGCVVKLGKGLAEVSVRKGGVIEAGAAASSSALLAAAIRAGLSGLEFLAGIPGTVGGALRMNAGTAGTDISEVASRIMVLSGKRVSWIEKDSLAFSYRCLDLPDGAIILGGEFKLVIDAPDAIASRVEAERKRRGQSQPVGTPNAGCWFRNPEGDSAGKLIDLAGLKGKAVGGARVSSVHANFFVNTGGAKAADFIQLAENVKEAVRINCGVDLKEEVHVFR